MVQSQVDFINCDSRILLWEHNWRAHKKQRRCVDAFCLKEIKACRCQDHMKFIWVHSESHRIAVGTMSSENLNAIPFARRHHAIKPSQNQSCTPFFVLRFPKYDLNPPKTIYASKAAGNRRTLSANLPWLLKNWTYAPSTKTLPPAFFSMYSSRRRGVKPQFLETMIFWRPGNLY